MFVNSLFVESKRRFGAVCVFGAAIVLGISLISPVTGFAAEDSRKIKSRVQPQYPEIARRANIAGTVKVEAVISPGGEVREAKVVGGHPLLGAAAVDAIKRWKYEPAPEQSTLIVEFNFHN